MREVIDIGDTVICDFCGEDYTNSTAEGGILFESKGVCPLCVPRLEADCKSYGEEQYIRGRARPGETFKAFCLRIRNGNNLVIIESS